jgi:hypothetical protein
MAGALKVSTTFSILELQFKELDLFCHLTLKAIKFSFKVAELFLF